VIAEPAELIREGICSALLGDSSYHISCRAERIEDAFASHIGAPPDVVILGLTRDGMDNNVSAKAALRMTLQAWPNTLVIALAHRDATGDLIRAVQEGARGALLLDTSAEGLRNAVRDVLAGGCVLDPRLTDRLFASVSSTPDTTLKDVAILPSGTLRRPLSARELEVLRELSNGLRNKEIAGRLGISAGTVKTHVASIFEKLQVNDRTAAAVMALRLNLLDAA
jgi:DNA-binding NarL/FixJ family response regulator